MSLKSPPTPGAGTPEDASGAGIGALCEGSTGTEFGVMPRGAQERFWGAVAFDVGDVGFQCMGFKCMGFKCMGFKCMGFKAPIKPADQIDQKESSKPSPARKQGGNARRR